MIVWLFVWALEALETVGVTLVRHPLPCASHPSLSPFPLTPSCLSPYPTNPSLSISLLIPPISLILPFHPTPPFPPQPPYLPPNPLFLIPPPHPQHRGPMPHMPQNMSPQRPPGHMIHPGPSGPPGVPPRPLLQPPPNSAPPGLLKSFYLKLCHFSCFKHIIVKSHYQGIYVYIHVQVLVFQLCAYVCIKG